MHSEKKCKFLCNFLCKEIHKSICHFTIGAIFFPIAISNDDIPMNIRLLTDIAFEELYK